MLDWLKKLGIGALGLLGAILVFLKLKPQSTDSVGNILEDRAKEIEDKLNKVREEEHKLDENGVKDLTDQEEIDYWKRQ